MVYALVSKGALASGSTSLAPAFGQATQGSDLLVAWLSSNDSGATNPFTTGAAGWVQAVATGAAFDWLAIWYKPNCSAGETAPVFTSSGASACRSMLAEFSGGVVSPLDSSGTASATSAETVTNAASDATSHDLIILNATWTGNAIATTIVTTITDSNGASVTPNETQDAGANSPNINMTFAYGFAGLTGASKDSATSTLGQFSAGIAGLVSFSPAPPGPATFTAFMASM